MANFKQSFRVTVSHERGHSDNPLDAGGETYNGISRVHWPKWGGWVLVDKGERDTPMLRELVESFYYDNFWMKIKGNDLPDQDIANYAFDIAVNGSVERSISFMQRVLNVLNRNQRDYADIEVDGAIGRETLGALASYLKKRNKYEFLNLYSVLMMNHWFERAESKPDQEEFINGINRRWVNNHYLVAQKHFLGVDHV